MGDASAVVLLLSAAARDPVRESADGQLDHIASGRRYRVFRRNGKLHHRESLLSADGSELDLCD